MAKQDELSKVDLQALLSEANKERKRLEDENDNLRANQFRIGDNVEEGYLITTPYPFTGETATIPFIMGRAFIAHDDPDLELHLRNIRSDWPEYDVHHMTTEEVEAFRASDEGRAMMAAEITRSIADVFPVPERP